MDSAINFLAGGISALITIGILLAGGWRPPGGRASPTSTNRAKVPCPHWYRSTDGVHRVIVDRCANKECSQWAQKPNSASPKLLGDIDRAINLVQFASREQAVDFLRDMAKQLRA